ncbi:MAG: hypothetical protein V5783_10775 [Pontiella sp.]
MKLINTWFYTAIIICAISNVYASEENGRVIENKLNIVVVVVDDVGYGGLSCFDNRNFKISKIARLCADGMKLTDFHSNGSVYSSIRARPG